MTVICRLTKLRHYIAIDSIDAITTAKLSIATSSKHHVSPTPSPLAGVLSLSQFSGRGYVRGSESNDSCPLPFTRRQMGSLRTRTKLWNIIYAPSLTSCRRIGLNWLPAAEFAVNNHTSETTEVTPFYANSGAHPRFGVEPRTNPPPMPSKQRLDAKDADEFAAQMEQLHSYLREQMTFAQTRYEKYSIRAPSPAYRVGD